MKKWNWFLFTVVVLISCAGALANVNIKTASEGFTLGLCIGVPVGLFVAWATKSN